jgi:hypothetical protein
LVLTWVGLAEWGTVVVLDVGSGGGGVVVVVVVVVVVGKEQPTGWG